MRKTGGEIGFCGGVVLALTLVCTPAGLLLAQTQTAAPTASPQSAAPATASVNGDHKAADPAPQPATTAPMSPKELRQAQLVADTNRLYKLAEELRVEVAKSSKDTLSLAVVKKAEEVEKLAKSLKERMRNE